MLYILLTYYKKGYNEAELVTVSRKRLSSCVHPYINIGKQKVCQFQFLQKKITKISNQLLIKFFLFLKKSIFPLLKTKQRYAVKLKLTMKLMLRLVGVLSVTQYCDKTRFMYKHFILNYAKSWSVLSNCNVEWKKNAGISNHRLLFKIDVQFHFRMYNERIKLAFSLFCTRI